jgi:hypothetical protein
VLKHLTVLVAKLKLHILLKSALHKDGQLHAPIIVHPVPTEQEGEQSSEPIRIWWQTEYDPARK